MCFCIITTSLSINFLRGRKKWEKLFKWLGGLESLVWLSEFKHFLLSSLSSSQFVLTNKNNLYGLKAHDFKINQTKCPSKC